jgi:hypothetical protein
VQRAVAAAVPSDKIFGSLYYRNNIRRLQHPTHSWMGTWSISFNERYSGVRTSDIQSSWTGRIGENILSGICALKSVMFQNWTLSCTPIHLSESQSNNFSPNNDPPLGQRSSIQIQSLECQPAAPILALLPCQVLIKIKAVSLNNRDLDAMNVYYDSFWKQDTSTACPLQW